MTNTWVFKWHKFMCVLLKILLCLIRKNRKRLPKDNYMAQLEFDAMQFQARQYTLSPEEISAIDEFLELERL